MMGNEKTNELIEYMVSLNQRIENLERQQDVDLNLLAGKVLELLEDKINTYR